MRSCHGTWPSFIKNLASFSRTSIATLQSRCTQYKSEQNYWHLLWTVICKLEHEFYKNNGSTFLKLRCKKNVTATARCLSAKTLFWENELHIIMPNVWKIKGRVFKILPSGVTARRSGLPKYRGVIVAVPPSSFHAAALPVLMVHIAWWIICQPCMWRLLEHEIVQHDACPDDVFGGGLWGPKGSAENPPPTWHNAECIFNEAACAAQPVIEGGPLKVLCTLCSVAPVLLKF